MKRLGISVYPEQSTEKEWKEYIKLAGELGFTRIFTCLISANETKDQIKKRFKAFCDYAHEYGFIVSVDTNPNVFEKLGASPMDLSIFHEMGVDIIRLDGRFDENENVMLTLNPYGILIEYNSSTDVDMDNLINAGANRDQMCMCTNFFPQRYTGMGLERYVELGERYLHTGVKNASFVTSLNEGTYGPWSICPNLPTLEMHRYLPIDLQVRHTFALGYVSDVLIGNAYATREELEAMAHTFIDFIKVKVDLEDDVTEIEKEILLRDIHANRPDGNTIIFRSSYPRTVYKGTSIKPRKHNRKTFKRGDVLMVNDNYSHYTCEVILVNQEIEANDTYNLIGHIQPNEEILLDCIKPRSPFGFLID